MQLTAFTDYALRILIAVAVHGERELSTVAQIANEYGISKNHVTKIVHQLSRSGYLKTIRGKGGGFRLSRPASDIRLGAVIRDMETHLALVPCFREDDDRRCAIEPACILKRALNEALRAFLAVTDDYTLADLVRPRRRLRTLLSVNP